MHSRDYYKKQYYNYCDFLSSSNYSDEFLSYINSTTASKNFYNKFNYSTIAEESLYNDYIKEVKYVVNTFGINNDDSTKLLNYLEYFRINCMYENYAGINERVKIDNVSPYNSAILGKGCCQSQTKYFLDILNESNFDNFKEFNIQIKNVSLRKHYYISFKYNNKLYYIDPSIYNGTVRSIEHTIISDDKHSDILYDKDIIIKSREFVLQEFCNKNKIRKSSFDLNVIKNVLLSMCIFKDYLSVGSVQIGDKEFEIGKVFESLCYINDIYYNIGCIGDKRNTMYSLLINNFFEAISFKNEYRKEKVESKFNKCQLIKNSIN